MLQRLICLGHQTDKNVGSMLILTCTFLRDLMCNEIHRSQFLHFAVIMLS